METNIQIQYENSFDNDNYWIRVRLDEEKKETVSFKELATVLDAVYKVDPCTGNMGDSPDDVRQQKVIKDPKEAKEILKNAFKAINYDPCKFYPNSYTYDRDIFIYRSHIKEKYTLLLNHGTSITTIETKDIDDFVKVNGTKITLKYYIIPNSLKTDLDIELINGSTIYFKEKIKGFHRFKYKTSFDRVTVTVPGLVESAQECKCVIFYHKMVSSLIITSPSQDNESVRLLGCSQGDVGSGDVPEPDNPDVKNCFRNFIYMTLCRCSKSLVTYKNVVMPVSCNDNGASSTALAAINGAIAHPLISTHYTECPKEEGTWEGADPEFYEITCCNPPSLDWTLPICKKTTEDYYESFDLQKIMDENPAQFPGDTVSFVPIPPENGICGEIVNKYEVNEKSCCDDPTYIDLKYDKENSIEVLADNTSGFIFWTGGAESVTVKINGQGFWLDVTYTQKEAKYTGHGAKIFTSDACGVCFIKIKDNCSNTESTIKSINGHWELIGGLDLCRERYYRKKADINYTSLIVGFEDKGVRVKQESWRYFHCAGCLTPPEKPDSNWFCTNCAPWNTHGCLDVPSELKGWDSPFLYEGRELPLMYEDTCGLGYGPDPSLGPCGTGDVHYIGGEKHYGTITVEEWKC